jgi:hypothetical protein
MARVGSGSSSTPVDDPILGLARTVADFAHEFVNASAASTRERNEYEHVREAQAALLLLRGHADVLLDLVKVGPGTYPSGWPIARSMLEVGVRSAWRMHHDDPLVAEGRWLAWLRRQMRLEQREAAWHADLGDNDSATKAAGRATTVTAFCDGVEAQLRTRGIEVPRGEPPMSAVLEDLGLKDRYRFYAQASERQHGSHIGLTAYTRNLGTVRVFGEFARPLDWVEPLIIAMGGLRVLTDVYTYRTETPELEAVRVAAQSKWDAYRLRLGEIDE